VGFVEFMAILEPLEVVRLPGILTAGPAKGLGENRKVGKEQVERRP